MARHRSGRRLTAIMFTDMVGYSALAQRNEALALRKLALHYRLVRALVPRFDGREIETAGDSFLLEFGSSLDAVRCALALQQQHAAYGRDLPEDQRIVIRIGVHLGDIEASGQKIMGDGVNVAARIEPLSPPGGVSVTEQIHAQVRESIGLAFQPLGPQHLKNIRNPVAVYVLDAALIATLKDETAFTPPQTRAGPQRLAAVLAASAATVLLIGGAVLLLQRAAHGVDKSVAVLPFENFGDPQNQYFTDGLQDSLITALAQVRDLKVIARSSVMQFRESPRDLRAIGRLLKVSRLVEGSVQKDGDHLRINVQLIDTETGGHLWAQLYDRNLSDVFALESEVSERVADSLQVALSGAGRQTLKTQPSINLEAYNDFLQGNFYYDRLGNGDLDKAVGFYEAALRLDPDNARVLAKLSSALSSIGDHTSGDKAAQAYARARSAAERALRLAPDLPQAHVALGWLLLNVDLRIADAETEFRRAEALGPNDDGAISGLAFALAHLGQFDAAIGMERRASELDPLYAGYHSNLCFYLTLIGRYDEAQQEANKALELEPGFPIVHKNLVITAIRRGDAAAALREAQLESDPIWKTYALALAETALGHAAAADAALHELTTTYADETPFQVASIYAFRGDADAAFTWLDRAYAAHDASISELLEDPFLRALKADSRFAAMCRKLGLPVPA